MTQPKLFEVEADTLECVLTSLKYSSVNSFNEDVKKIQEWMKEQPHLPEIMDDKKVQNFLILNKGSVEKSKQKIDSYYTIRTKLPEVFEHINPKLPYLQHVLNAMYLVPLPKLTKDMYRVFVCRSRGKALMEKLNPLDGFLCGLNLQEIRLIEDVTYGDVFIFDGQDLPFGFLAKISPVMIHKALNLIYRRVFSNRVKAIYMINNPFADKCITLFKVVLKAKLLDRIHVCQNSNFLIERFGKDMIPRDYGGEEKSLAELQDIFAQKLHQYAEYFDRLDELRVDEKLRPEKLADDDILGFYGNFKQIEID